MTTIVGVDFSGHRDDRNTWVARGLLDTGGALLIDSVQPARRSDLHELLAAIRAPAVATLDFPFGVPAEFASGLSPNRPPRAMPDLWRTVAGMSAGEFLAARDRFVADHGELKRSGDARHFPESFSPLHRANPNMLPMTYEGIRLLQRWREDHPRRWHVPPLEPPAPPDRTVTLLELMPGAFLKALGLPFKGYKKGRRASELREEITGAHAAGAFLDSPDRAAPDTRVVLVEGDEVLPGRGCAPGCRASGPRSPPRATAGRPGTARSRTGARVRPPGREPCAWPS